MDAAVIEAVSTAFQNLGFPIVACGAMFWYLNKEKEAHKEELSDLRKSLDNNTKVLNKILIFLEVVKNGSTGLLSEAAEIEMEDGNND